ncbi:MAG: lycopene cyclase domain-containing protein [Flavobacteriales bacterium]|nr:lycopene cyclase domain-containing protein [Flavobacteriales bacterium]
MERYLYLLLDLGSIAFPLLASFEPRIRFHRKWPGLFAGIAVAGAVFIVWDALFTAHGVWGFNDRYLAGPRLWGMPIEEWLFFLMIPYACLFLYEVMRHFVKRDILGRAARPLSIALIVVLTAIGLLNLGRLYTSITFLGTAVFLAWIVFLHRPAWLGRFYVGYGISLIPFFLVNGVLTGSVLPEPVVWYNDAHNLGIRMGTIPLEDSIYLLLLLLMVTVFYERPLKRPHGDLSSAG